MKAKRPVGWRRWPLPPRRQPPGYAAVARRRAGFSDLLAAMAELAGDSAQKAWAFHDAWAVDWRRWPATAPPVRASTRWSAAAGCCHTSPAGGAIDLYLADFTCCCTAALPAGDGAIAYGQAVIAPRRPRAGSRECNHDNDSFTPAAARRGSGAGVDRGEFSGLVLALQAFGDSGALMAASLLAWGYGLRHAVGADHIAAIDNVTRKMMQQGRRPFAVGAWFSLGHSSIVVLASAAIAATATAFSTQMSWLHDTGSVIGTAVSALFLPAMAFINSGDFTQRVAQLSGMEARGAGERRNRQRRRGDELAVWQDLPSDKPQLARCTWSVSCLASVLIPPPKSAYWVSPPPARRADFRLVDYGLSRRCSPAVWRWWIRFDNVLMVGAYGWAFSKARSASSITNMTITGTSVVVALFIGGLEALGLLMDKFALSGGIWRWVGALNDNLGDAGLWWSGCFVACWALSVLNYRWRGYDNLAR